MRTASDSKECIKMIKIIDATIVTMIVMLHDVVITWYDV